MAASFEALHDKPIEFVGQGTTQTGRLLCLLSGDDYTVRIECSGSTFESSSPSAFGALAEIRLRLEDEGLIPALEGARRDVYPSRMALDMGGGRRSHRWPAAGRPFTVVGEASGIQFHRDAERMTGSPRPVPPVVDGLGGRSLRRRGAGRGAPARPVLLPSTLEAARLRMVNGGERSMRWQRGKRTAKS